MSDEIEVVNQKTGKLEKVSADKVIAEDDADEKLIDPKKRRKEKLIELLTELQIVVGDMSNLYDKNPKLNDEFDISRIVPMSLDEWAAEINEVIDEVSNA